MNFRKLQFMNLRSISLQNETKLFFTKLIPINFENNVSNGRIERLNTTAPFKSQEFSTKKLFIESVSYNMTPMRLENQNVDLLSKIPSYSPIYFPPVTRRPVKNPFPTIIPSIRSNTCSPSTLLPSILISYNTFSNNLNTFSPSISNVPTTLMIKSIEPIKIPIKNIESVSIISENIQYYILSILGVILIIISVLVIRCFLIRFTDNSDLEKIKKLGKKSFQFNEETQTLNIDIDLSDIIDSKEVDINYERLSPSKIRLLVGTEKKSQIKHLNPLKKSNGIFESSNGWISPTICNDTRSVSPISNLQRYKPIITPTNFMKQYNMNYYPRIKHNNSITPLTTNLDWLTEEHNEHKSSNVSPVSIYYKDPSSLNESFSTNNSVLNKLFSSVSKKSLSDDIKTDDIKTDDTDDEQQKIHQQQLNYFISPQTNQLLSPKPPKPPIQKKNIINDS